MLRAAINGAMVGGIGHMAIASAVTIGVVCAIPFWAMTKLSDKQDEMLGIDKKRTEIANHRQSEESKIFTAIYTKDDPEAMLVSLTVKVVNNSNSDIVRLSMFCNYDNFIRTKGNGEALFEKESFSPVMPPVRIKAGETKMIPVEWQANAFSWSSGLHHKVKDMITPIRCTHKVDLRISNSAINAGL